LIAPIDPPLGRSLVFAKADAELVIADRRYPLFANRWASGVVVPEGHLAIESFELDGVIPVWRFAVGACRIEQRIWMEPGANTTYVGWRLLSAAADLPVRLSVTLLANGRDHHGETWIPGFAPEIAVERGALTMSMTGRFALRLLAPSGEIAPRRDWIENFDLPLERERGLGDRDHHLCVGQAEIPLVQGVWCGIVASTAPDPSPDIAAALSRRRAYDGHLLARAIAADPALACAPSWVMRLVQACDLYVIARAVPEVEDGRSVIAGYPWFGDWGRDTMIALPGLCLATGRLDDARNILETFARFVDRGMLPNVFPGAGDRPEYNTVDAALWYIEAWRGYVVATGDVAALERAYPVLAEIVECHQRGTRYGIAVDPADGLLRAGEPGEQLTWMDARVDGREVTPRIGKPVEINALWYNALLAMAGFAERLGKAEPYAAVAARARAGFQRFVKPGGEGLFDVIDGPLAMMPPCGPTRFLPSACLSHRSMRRRSGACWSNAATSC
jgi:4-alpha-glucanotransferase